MAEDLNKEKLGKVVAMAKKGIGGEKDAAIAILKAMCAKHKLIYEDLMSDDNELYEYVIHYKNQEEFRILGQVVCRYAYLNIDQKQGFNAIRKVVIFKTTKEKYLETLHAFDVYKVQWEKEREKMKDAIYYAFIERHQLYYAPRQDEIPKLIDQMTKDKSIGSVAREAGNKIARYMDDVKIHKRLS
jgi:hypothetical protein